MDRMVIHGQCPSKSNSYHVVTLHGHGSLAKRKVLKEYERAFFIQCPLRDRMIQGYFEMHIDVYFTSQSHDLDNTLKIVLDCLQACRVIKNDNRCVKIVARKFIDKADPRIELELREEGV
ncbi:RusA family crossover junction endodeoxyribonuclease [Prevotella sp. KH2C16]|uniref:RusA family crossover junction endodeoxyribonuclease n=1 Tax=Prevotella sp. KH2C16 TaxID=1855325 RepID=UPI0008EF2575|nr:RusA family crossover junction endodeoxyribonuclease [Prevotella sp. KH2C16]SFG13004.1 Endodeoxyribonuclease RusA [Prevotella sp. KH2C16]